MLIATGGSAICAIEELVSHGARTDRMVFATVVSCPEGISRVQVKYPELTLITAAIDEGLNEQVSQRPTDTLTDLCFF